MKLLLHIGRRLGVGLLQLALVTVAIFLVIRLLPADPVARIIGFNASPEVYEQARTSLNLDKPIGVQLGIFIGLWPEEFGPGLLQGSLGRSFASGDSVTTEILSRIAPTLELIVLSFSAAVAVSLPLALVSAVRQTRVTRRVIYVYGLFAGAQPEFWWGLAFSYIFFFQLGIAPAPIGRISPSFVYEPTTGAVTIDALLARNGDLLVDSLQHLFLPVLTLAFVLTGPIVKMLQANLETIINSTMIRVARAMGLSRMVLARYALRSVVAPSMTLVAILFGFMIGGAVLVEQVFALGGLGQYSIRAILASDYPAIQGSVLAITAVALLSYLVLDVVHALVDPRIVTDS